MAAPDETPAAPVDSDADADGPTETEPLTTAQAAAISLVKTMSTVDRDRQEALSWRRRGLIGSLAVFIGLVVLVFTGIPLTVWFTGSGNVAQDQEDLMQFLVLNHDWIGTLHIVGALLMLTGLGLFSYAVEQFERAHALLPDFKGSRPFRTFWAQVLTLLLMASVLAGGVIGMLLPDRPDEDIVQRQTAQMAQQQGSGSYIDNGVMRAGDLVEAASQDLPHLPSFLLPQEQEYQLHAMALPFVIALLSLAFLLPVYRLQTTPLAPTGKEKPNKPRKH